MQRRSGSVLLLVVLATVLAMLAAGPCTADWTVTDLGVLDGFAHSRAVATNASGQVVGDCYNGNPGVQGAASSQAFVWEDEVMTGLPALEGFLYSKAAAINASGQIVGTCWNDQYCCDCEGAACLWEPDGSGGYTVSDLGKLDGHAGSMGVMLNDAGQVVIHSWSGRDAVHMCPSAMVDGGAITVIGGDLGIFMWPEDLNANGQVVGHKCCSSSGTSVAVLWDSGVTTVLTPDRQGEAHSINDQGEVVGLVLESSTMNFLWLPAAAYDLDAGSHTYSREPGTCCERFQSINNAGQVLWHVSRRSAAEGRDLTEIRVLDLATGLPVTDAILPRARAWVMNPSGIVVGRCDSPDLAAGGWDAYYLAPGLHRAYLPGLSGDLDGQTEALDMNAAGDIVGYSVAADGLSSRATRWTGTPPANQAPVLDALTTPLAGVAGIAMSFVASASDPDLGETPSLVFGLAGAPAGAGIDARTGEFSWAPAAAGDSAFDVTVTDGELSDSQSVTVNVVANEPPVLNAITTPIEVTLGGTASFTATASDTESETVSFSLSSAPAGASIGATTGAFSWTPSAAGSYTFTVWASDANGSDSQSVTVNVSALVISSATLSRNKRGIVTVSVTITNPSTTAADNVKITSASLGGGTLTTNRLPISLHTIRAGASKSYRLQFTGVSAGSATFSVAGTSDLGSFSKSATVTVP